MKRNKVYSQGYILLRKMILNVLAIVLAIEAELVFVLWNPGLRALLSRRKVGRDARSRSPACLGWRSAQGIVVVQLLSRVRLSAAPWTAAH